MRMSLSQMVAMPRAPGATSRERPLCSQRWMLWSGRVASENNGCSIDPMSVLRAMPRVLQMKGSHGRAAACRGGSERA